MMQGDSYYLSIRLKNNAGQPITPLDVEDVEVTIGRRTKSYKNGKILFEDGLWFYPVTQAESFEFRPMKANAQVRVKWNGGVIEGQELTGIRVQESSSKEVL